MSFFESQAFKIISGITDILTFLSFIYASYYAINNRTKSLFGFNLARVISDILKTGLIILAIVIVIQIVLLFHKFLILIALDGNKNYYGLEGLESVHILVYLFDFIVITISIWVISTIIWTGSLLSTKKMFNHFRPKNKQAPNEYFNNLSIINAKYGINESFFDVTGKLRGMISDNKLVITSSNLLAGDPIYGVNKKLIIIYKYGDSNEKKIEIPEGNTATISL